MSYYFNRKVDLSFEEAIERVTEELKDEGFGILAEIATTIRKKLKSVIDKL